MDCVGFCEYYARPLFNKNADESSRCASQIGRRVETVAASVGFPTLVLGGLLFAFGLSLCLYDHL